MKNDPMIHAKASAIVEAISQMHFKRKKYSLTSHDKDVITEALASLNGGDSHPSEREVLSEEFEDVIINIKRMCNFYVNGKFGLSDYELASMTERLDDLRRSELNRLAEKGGNG